MGIQQTSLDAFEQIRHELGERQILVYQAFKKHGLKTNLELSVLLEIPINQVTPRTNELVKKGFIKEKGRRPCSISGRNAIIWGVHNQHNHRLE